MGHVQQILNGFQYFQQVMEELRNRRCMLVCDASFPFLSIKDRVRADVVFSDFSPNPLYEDVCKGVRLFNDSHCEALVAIGGGSAIDVAKCTKLYCRMDATRNYLEQEPMDSHVPLVAIPTTAGTGSESTRFAVIYYEGRKQSIAHESIVPDYAILEPSLLRSLPVYQKKCTMLDALCQGIESLWSVNSTPESMAYSEAAIGLIVEHWQGYIERNDEECAAAIMRAANSAGRAINITQTTAPHAMSYKLTSRFHLPHGHAVALCMLGVWRYMMAHMERCVDRRGPVQLRSALEMIDRAMLRGGQGAGIECFEAILCALGMEAPHSEDREADLDLLVRSVNPVRLKNNPVALDEEAIRQIYDKILL